MPPASLTLGVCTKQTDGTKQNRRPRPDWWLLRRVSGDKVGEGAHGETMGGGWTAGAATLQGARRLTESAAHAKWRPAFPPPRKGPRRRK